MNDDGNTRSNNSVDLTIGIVGFGNFGQFLAKTFVKQGHSVVGMSRADYSAEARALSVTAFVQCADDLLAHNPNVIIFCTSIMSTKLVLSKFPLERLENALVVDVLSVKTYPKQLLLSLLPPSTDIICTHPMFGPESGRDSWQNLPFVFEKVRVSASTEPRARVFLEIWEREGCAMVEMSCEQHDEFAASTQFLTHTTGRMLANLDVKSTPINTKGYESLLSVVDTTCKDSFDLFYGLYKYNPNAKKELHKMELALAALKRQLDEHERKDLEQNK